MVNISSPTYIFSPHLEVILIVSKEYLLARDSFSLVHVRSNFSRRGARSYSAEFVRDRGFIATFH